MSAPRHPRPQSSLSVRSNLSTLRPSSSASLRPLSRVSQRPQSRLAKLNQARLLPLCHQLVNQILGEVDEQDDEERDRELDRRRALVESVSERVDAITLTKASAGMDLKAVERTLHGHIQKARINSRDQLAEALDTSYRQLKEHLSKDNDLDQELKLTHLPSLMQFLFSISNSPSPATLDHASMYLDDQRNPRQEEKPLTWEIILAEEPFEGQHWEGVYGLPPGAVKGIHTEDDTDSSESSPSWSPLHSDDLELDLSDEANSGVSLHKEEPDPPLRGHQSQSKPVHSYAHRKDVEDLQARQYWRPEWQMTERFGVRFDIGDVSVLGPTLQKVLGRGPQNGLPAEILQLSDKYIYERDCVREVLIALQGRKNIVLEWQDDAFVVTEVTPKLRHFSLLSQYSILSSFGKTATTIKKLRTISKAIIVSPSQTRRRPRTRTARTLEAFADAIAQEILRFDSWCADREQQGCAALAGVPPSSSSTPDDEDPNPNKNKLVVSLLSTEKAVRDNFSDTFDVLLDVVSTVLGSVGSAGDDWTLPPLRSPPSITATHLLDTLFASVQENLEKRDTVVADALMRVFVTCAEPIWAMVGHWLKDGISVGSVSSLSLVSEATQRDELDEEFFIECLCLPVGGVMNVGLLDPEFWAEGYKLRHGDDDEEGSRRRGIPAFLLHVAEPVLSCGKAIGLSRVLGVIHGETLRWRSFSQLLAEYAKKNDSPSISGPQQAGVFSVSVDTLSRIIYDELTPYCLAMSSLLSNAIANQCDLWQHLRTTHDLYFMKRGDVMSNFADRLFSKMDNQQHWTDFHTLNTAFNDTVEANNHADAQEWIELPLVRLSYRGQGAANANKSVRALEGLLVEYAYPFPLTYIFTPKAMQVYGEVLIFLFQIRRAKRVLENVLVRSDKRTNGNDIKALYALRTRLRWFIDTLLNFLTMNVIHTQTQSFHELLQKAASLDEIIRLHNELLDRIQRRCLLQGNTSSLHSAVQNILDLCLKFTDLFTTQGTDTITPDVSQSSISRRRHRSRRQRRQRKNIIGFFEATKAHDDSSSSEDEEQFDEMQVPLQSFSFAAHSVDNGFSQVDQMSTELDGLVRFIRRGAESLAGKTEDAGPTFGILAFALEDWDL